MYSDNYDYLRLLKTLILYVIIHPAHSETQIILFLKQSQNSPSRPGCPVPSKISDRHYSRNLSSIRRRVLIVYSMHFVCTIRNVGQLLHFVFDVRCQTMHSGGLLPSSFSPSLGGIRIRNEVYNPANPRLLSCRCKPSRAGFLVPGAWWGYTW